MRLYSSYKGEIYHFIPSGINCEVIPRSFSGHSTHWLATTSQWAVITNREINSVFCTRGTVDGIRHVVYTLDGFDMYSWLYFPIHALVTRQCIHPCLYDLDADTIQKDINNPKWFITCYTSDHVRHF